MGAGERTERTAGSLAATPGDLSLEQGLQAYGMAGRTLNDWTAGAHALALLQAAMSSGILGAAQTASTPGEIAAATGLDVDRVADLCLALDAHGVLDESDGAYVLSQDFATLAGAEAPQSLPTILERAVVTARVLAQSALPGGAYGALSDAELLAMARGAAAQPGSALALGAMQRMYDTRPEVKAIHGQGGRHLELGCGVGGALLHLLVLFPAVTAVGVEREPPCWTRRGDARPRSG